MTALLPRIIDQLDRRAGAGTIYTMKPDGEVSLSELTFHPLTAERWSDFVTLFGTQGGYGGCWCMWWRQTRREFDQHHGNGNRDRMKQIVESDTIPGIIAYVGGQPAGWCSVAPRADFDSLGRSRILRPIDDAPVWSIVCFYVGKQFRGQNLIEDLIKAAINYVRDNGGRIVEAYPTISRGRRLPVISTFMGFPEVFERVGFMYVARPSKARAVMRYYLENQETDS